MKTLQQKFGCFFRHMSPYYNHLWNSVERCIEIMVVCWHTALLNHE